MAVIFHHLQLLSGPENDDWPPTVSGTWKRDTVSSPHSLQEQVSMKELETMGTKDHGRVNL